MHSVANVATLQNPLATFSLQKSAQNLFCFGEWPVLPHKRDVLLSQRAHLSLSHYLFLSNSLSISLHLHCSASGREEQHFQLNTDIILLTSLILHASIAKITAQLLSFYYVYLISSADSSIIRIFYRLTSWKVELM